ncbi:MAG: MAPEG family protein [Candidatus Neomarinimicrobiota bacterium]|nr:MAPEG family protein [Candidatus Neomarinimicrobiota bacterium]
MDSNLILIPLALMVALTLLVTARLYFVQRRAIKGWEVRYGYFKTYEGDRPEYLQAARDHYKNMFELPLLFYVWVIVVYLMESVDRIDLGLAWLFIISRIIHSGIRIADHTKLRNRFAAFTVGWFVVVIAWSKLLLGLL